MAEQQQAGAQMCAITVSRQYGSGGGEVASRLAARLGWRLFDHEAVVNVARELGISVVEAEARDEYGESLGEQILNSLRVLQPTMSASLPAAIVTDTRAYHEALSRVIEAAVADGPVVIVGRGAQIQLANRRDILHVRVVAPLEQRIAYVMRREGLARNDAVLRIEQKDRARIRYLEAQYHRHPNDPSLYDLVVNTGIISLDRTVDLICQALQAKAERLTAPEAELGPGAGVTPYPGRAEDFRVPPTSK